MSASSGPSQVTSRQRRVYMPHKAQIPPLDHYFRDLWERKDFALELSHTNLRASNTNTFLGQLWLVVNPLLLAGVYYLLTVVLSGGRGSAGFPHIAAGIFLFFYVTGSMQACATSVTNAGSLVLNMNFPKMLLIFSNVYLALRRFLPTLIVYFAIHLIWGLPWTWHLLWMIPVILLATMLGIGLGAIMATWQVYFRDTAQFMPYFIRIWLYASPVLFTVQQFMTSPIGKRLGSFVHLNPMHDVLSIWHDALGGIAPSADNLGFALAWSLVLLVGGSLYFISRERDFAVRL